MKRYLIAAICLCAAVLQAQTPADNLAGDYEEQFARLNKAYAKSPNDVELLVSLAQFYFDNSNPMRNLPMAMTHIRHAEESHVKLLEEDRLGVLSRLARKNITLTTIRQTKQAICDAAYNTLEVRTDLSGAELQSYLDAFGIDMDLVRLLRQRRINQVYDEDLRKGTPDAFYHFISTYPGTREAEQMEERLAKLAPGLFEGVSAEAQADTLAAAYPLSPSVQRAGEKCKSRLAYDYACRVNTAAAYNDFLRRHPSSDEHLQARQRLANLLEMKYASLHTARQYADFVDSNADNALADNALAQLRRLIYENRDIEAAQLYLARFKHDPYYSEVFSKYYSWHAEEGNAAPINSFLARYPDFPFRRAVENDLERAAQIDAVNLMEDFIDIDFEKYASYVRSMMGKRIAFVPLQRMIQSQVSTHSYNAALDRIQQFDICFENVSTAEYNELKELLASPATGSVLTPVLTATYDIQNPAFNASDGLLYYTRVNGPSHKICYATQQGSSWTPTGEVEFSNTDNENLTFFGFYADGSRMLLGSAGDIWIAEKDGDRWRVSDIPPYPVNTDYVETDAFMLPDGSGLLLASDRPNGQNIQSSGSLFHGDTALASDLYFIPYTQAVWGEAVNLGIAINTPYSERSPILSRNLKTLYFVTDGRGGLGYGDVYTATRANIEDWTRWSTPRNIGKDLNTGFREATVGFGADEKTLLISSNFNLGRYSCYSIPAKHNAANSYNAYTLDIAGLEDYLFRVRVADLNQQSVAQTLEYNGDGHVLSLNIHKDKVYAVLGDAGIYFVPAVIVEPQTKTRSRLKGYTFPSLVAMDKPLPLPAVDFDGATAVLRPVALLQMEQLAQFLTNNPSSTVEITVDVAGRDDAQSYNLSLERGRALRNYLTVSGIADDRVSISAYGNVNAKRGAKPGVALRFREKK